MKKFRIFSGILALVLAAIAGTPAARAGDINGPAMAGLVLNDTIPDSDLYALSLFVGTSMDKLHTKEIDTTTSFSQTLSGTYAGLGLSVTYTGDPTAFPGGPVTWTSSGTYGAQAWNSSGSATFTFPTASTFQVAYSSSLTVGSNTLLDNTTISGADNGTYLYYTGTTGTLTLNHNAPVPAPMKTSDTALKPYVGIDDYDDIEVDGKRIITSIDCIYEIKLSPNPPYPPILIKSAGHISFVPEPSTLVLASFGILAMLLTWQCRNRSSG
jgi:hypothetical protein